MCRWAAYIGEPIYLEDVVTAPGQSLISQPLRAHESVTETNGDGFGVAWYGDRDVPGVYRDVLPAWSDANLRSLAHQVRSTLFLAHVRAATGTATSRSNCHPFTARGWCFMHNGQFRGYSQFRREVDMLIPPEIYLHREGTTDSEALFLLALGEGLAEDPLGALARATAKMEGLASAAGLEPHTRLTVAMTDGRKLYAARYATDTAAPTLYHRRTELGRAVVSEPLDRTLDDWEMIAPDSFVEISPDGITVSDFDPAMH